MPMQRIRVSICPEGWGWVRDGEKVVVAEVLEEVKVVEVLIPLDDPSSSSTKEISKGLKRTNFPLQIFPPSSKNRRVRRSR